MKKIYWYVSIICLQVATPLFGSDRSSSQYSGAYSFDLAIGSEEVIEVQVTPSDDEQNMQNNVLLNDREKKFDDFFHKFSISPKLRDLIRDCCEIDDLKVMQDVCLAKMHHAFLLYQTYKNSVMTTQELAENFVLLRDKKYEQLMENERKNDEASKNYCPRMMSLSTVDADLQKFIVNKAAYKSVIKHDAR